jgi:hypothetical protein
LIVGQISTFGGCRRDWVMDRTDFSVSASWWG